MENKSSIIILVGGIKMFNKILKREKGSKANKASRLVLYIVIGLVIVGSGVGITKLVSSNIDDSTTNVVATSNNAVKRVSPIGQKGIDYYLSKNGEGVDPSDLEARLKNLGCHMEIHIYNKGELVAKYNYFGGQIFE